MKTQHSQKLKIKIKKDCGATKTAILKAKCANTFNSRHYKCETELNFYFPCNIKRNWLCLQRLTAKFINPLLGGSPHNGTQQTAQMSRIWETHGISFCFLIHWVSTTPCTFFPGDFLWKTVLTLFWIGSTNHGKTTGPGDTIKGHGPARPAITSSSHADAPSLQLLFTHEAPPAALCALLLDPLIPG